MTLDFEKQLEYGEDGEHIVADYLLKKEFVILPLYQFENKNQTPYLLYDKKLLILPDLTVWKNGKTYFIEVKRKRQWVKFKNKIETGINYKLFKSYEEITLITDSIIYLWFVHEYEEPTGFYYIELNKFKNNSRYWDGVVGNSKKIMGQMLFVGIEYLTKVAK